ncbi:hypothetical protein GS489_07560 [Rhodococcus hoagii]|nr:hypothetical protein [Prescottella equi]MBM4617998.1 hypothetical protein [Prescottella equi]
MAALTTKVLSNDGSAPTFVAANATDTAAVGNGLNTFLVYRNSNATAGTTASVAITPPGKTPYGENWTPKNVTVPGANGEKWIPLRREYADDTGRVTITHSGAALGDLKVAVVQVG